MTTPPNIAELRAFAEGRTAPPRFDADGEGRYRLALAGVVELELDYLRRDGGQLKAELLVRTELPGVTTTDGVVSVMDANLSSARSRESMAKFLAGRAKIQGVDWSALLEELALRVLAAERAGEPATVLADLPDHADDDHEHVVDGLHLPARHPSVLFGDGGTAKSLLALYVAAKLAQRGTPVLFADWELDAESHRRRLGRIFGDKMPRGVLYARCSRPLIYEADRLRRIVRDEAVGYLVADSAAFGCDGPPEAAEVAGRYMQALRRLGVGALVVAHVSKATEGADLKPFGSVFWSNAARSTWNTKRAGGEAGDDVLRIALHHRKSNLSGRRRSVGFEIRFDAEQTLIRATDPALDADLSRAVSLRQRVEAALRRGPMSRPMLVAALDLEDGDRESFGRILRRCIQQGKVIQMPGAGEVLALAERRAS